MVKKKKIKLENRPVCACGVKMKLVEYRGYYDGFRYWECDNCMLDDDIQKDDVGVDRDWLGAYA